jgi:hypothetical protein
MLTHEDHVEELKSQLTCHPDLPLVIISEYGAIEHEIVDCMMENVLGKDQITVSLERK